MVAPGVAVTAWAMVAMLLMCRVCSECICRLQPLILADVVDEDTFLHRRPVSMAASVGGTLSVVSKPGQSLAPVLGCWYLGLAGAANPDAQTSALSAGLFFLVQIGTSSCLLAVWRGYQLEGHRLDIVRRRERGLTV